MQLLAIGLAASLVFAPGAVAPPATSSEPADAAVEGTDEPADETAGEPSEAEPEPTPEPTPEPEPEPEPTPTAELAPELAPEPELATTSVSEVPPPPVVRDRLGCQGSKPCRRMSIAGIVVGTVGLAAVGTGIGLLVKTDEVLPEAPAYVTSTRPAGLVALTVGAGVALTAVLMLVASHRGYKQRPNQARRIELTASGLRF